LIKFKSKERENILKNRGVLSQHKFVYRNVSKVIGRALTLTVVSMKELLHFVRSAVREREDPAPGQHLQWVELDLVEMFPNISREDIVPALRWLFDEVRKKKQSRGNIRFYIAKSGLRKLDNHLRGPSDSFYVLTFEVLLQYVSFDLVFNTSFICLGEILTQLTGTPIGGSLSAQLACMVMVYREH
jgi:hypothetical protein